MNTLTPFGHFNQQDGEGGSAVSDQFNQQSGVGGGGQGAVRFQPINIVSALLADSISGGRVGCTCIKTFITRGVGGAIQS